MNMFSNIPKLVDFTTQSFLLKRVTKEYTLTTESKIEISFWGK